MKLTKLILLAIGVKTILAECPSTNSVPVMHPGLADTFNCARVWMGPSDPQPIQSCNTCDGHEDFADIFDGESRADLYIGSMIVQPGCTFYGFSEPDYHGEVREYSPGLHSEVDTFNDGYIPGCSGFFESAKCRCEQKLVSCTPTDGYKVITECDNTDGSQTAQCKYSKTVGTDWTEETEEHMDISAGVYYEIQAGMFGLFEETLGVSTETGYDWTETSSQTMGESQTIEVSEPVPSGERLQILQAVGHCNGNDANTELFKFLSTNLRGEILRVRLERQFRDGTVILVE